VTLLLSDSLDSRLGANDGSPKARLNPDACKIEHPVPVLQSCGFARCHRGFPEAVRLE
jgi:hypothetical protein